MRLKHLAAIGLLIAPTLALAGEVADDSQPLRAGQVRALQAVGRSLLATRRTPLNPQLEALRESVRELRAAVGDLQRAAVSRRVASPEEPGTTQALPRRAHTDGAWRRALRRAHEAMLEVERHCVELETDTASARGPRRALGARRMSRKARQLYLELDQILRSDAQEHAHALAELDKRLESKPVTHPIDAPPSMMVLTEPLP